MKGLTQRKGFDCTNTYAPVVNIVTVCTLLAFLVQKNLNVIQMDVTTAFLNRVVEEAP